MRAWIVEKGRAREVSLDEAAAVHGRCEFAWFHLHGREPAALDWLNARQEIPDVARKALIAEETRPRVEKMGHGALVNLRGLSETPELDPDALVSIRIWAEQGRVVSVALRQAMAMRSLCDTVAEDNVRDPGDLIAALATHITDALDPEVAAIGDRLDECELMMEEGNVYKYRRSIGQARRQAINYRRFVAPQRLALDRLATLDAAWLQEDDRLHLRDAADRCARMAEELEAIRERAALLGEQLTDLRAEQLDSRSLMIAVVAFVFLPLTFLTGLFGMNVKLPLPDNQDWPFWYILAASGLITVGILGWFFLRWLRR